MDPSAALSSCQQGFRGAGVVALVNPWVLVLVGVAPPQGFGGVVAVVNPWILVLVRVAPQQGFGGDVAVVNPWTLVLV